MRSTLLYVLLLVTVAGCGRGTSGSVQGTVTIDAQPLPLGTIAFLTSDGRVVSGVIDNGHYAVSRVPLGPARVTVQAHELSPMMVPATGPPKGSSAAARAPRVEVPARYAEPNRSGLEHQVTAGVQTYDIVLER